ncbi:MAG: hypothetical protein ACRDXD_13935 [Acidimicrobiia bacterium]
MPSRLAPPSAEFRWRDASERQKWIMTWGITWRQWVAGLVIWVVFLIIFLLLAAMLGGFADF